MNSVALQTPRLLLRPWTPGDVEALFEILQEPDLLRYFPNPDPPGRDIVETYINRQLAHWKEFGYGHWAVILPEEDQVLGWNGLEFLPELGECEVAYLLSRRVWGRGYATESARAALRFGFERAGLGSIIGLVHPENEASIRVLKKCGLSFVDRINLWRMDLYRYRLGRGVFENLCAATSQDWQAEEIRASGERR